MKVHRNVQIWLRRRRGESYRQIAKDVGLSAGRVWEICNRVDDRLRRALMHRGRNAYYDPYAYDVWFCFEAGKPGAKVEL